MSKFRVVYTDNGFKNIDAEKRIIESAHAELVVKQCKTSDEVKAAAANADALLVQWAPVNADVIAALDRCKIIVRIGIGVDNVDIEAAAKNNIPVCNVPDYCIDEVSDHTIAMALCLARQLPQSDKRVRSGHWSIIPAAEMPAFRQMTLATVGFGRIARAVHRRARNFSFRLAAYDKFVGDETIQKEGVKPIELRELFEQADIISLHCQLTSETKHLVDTEALKQMKKTAILINTARGGLVDTSALADALKSGSIASAGLDVFEEEPLPEHHPIRSCENALLTSHTAWYSESSVPALQEKAAEELVRGLLDNPLQNRVN